MSKKKWRKWEEKEKTFLKTRVLEIFKKKIEKGEYGIARRDCMDYAKEILDKVESKKMSVYEADEMFTEAFVQLDLEKLGEETPDCI